MKNILLNAFVLLAWVAATLGQTHPTENAAMTENAKARDLIRLFFQIYEPFYSEARSTCKARSTLFEANCSNVSNADCTTYTCAGGTQGTCSGGGSGQCSAGDQTSCTTTSVCSGVSHCSTQLSNSACQNAQCSGVNCNCAWSACNWTSYECSSFNGNKNACDNANGCHSQENKVKNVCCKDGEKKCELDAHGNEYSLVGPAWRCCDACIGTNPPSYCTASVTQSYYDSNTADGEVVICPATGYGCFECRGSGLHGGTPESESECTAKGTCTAEGIILSSFSQSDCTNSKGKCHGPGNMRYRCTFGEKSSCENSGLCSKPSGATHSGCSSGDRLSCLNDQTCGGNCNCTWTPCNWTAGTWAPATWIAKPQHTDEDSCKSENKCFQCANSSNPSQILSVSGGNSSCGACSGGNPGKCNSGDSNTCQSSGFCSRPEGGTQGCTSGDYFSCVGDKLCNSQSCNCTWTDCTWGGGTVVHNAAVTADKCTDDGRSGWKQENNIWVSGTAHPGFPMTNYNTNDTCISGASCNTDCLVTGQLKTSADLLENLGFGANDYVNDTQLYEDLNAGITGALAYAANKVYYNRLLKWMIAGNARVVAGKSLSNPTAQNVDLRAGGFILLFKPRNTGSITTSACNPCPVASPQAADQHVLVYDPQNYNVEGASISFSLGKITVVGGDNYGEIDFTTTGRVRLNGINNEGTVSFANSQDIYVGDIQNTGGISFMSTTATFVNVTNHAQGTVSVNGGTYTA